MVVVMATEAVRTVMTTEAAQTIIKVMVIVSDSDSSSINTINSINNGSNNNTAMVSHGCTAPTAC